MYCPKCKTEYREGFTTCADCGSKLIETPLTAEKPPKEELFYPNWQYLITASGSNEATVIASILQGEDIPVNKMAEGAGGYLQITMGFTTFGVKIYVPKEYLEKAKEVISSYKPSKSIEEERLNNEEKVTKKEKVRNIVWTYWAISAVVGAVIVVLMGIIAIWSYFKYGL